jgi:SOS response regulatory protein OraA/RecX
MPDGEERRKLYQKMLAAGFSSTQVKAAFEASDTQSV